MRRLWRAVELRAHGVDKHAIDAAVAKGLLSRPYRGIVGAPDVDDHPRLQEAAAVLLTGGIIGYGSAAARHSLNDDMPDHVDVIVPSQRTRAAPTMGIVLHRTRVAAALSVGIEEEDVLGIRVRMTDRPRTVVDLYRRGDVRQHALQALQTYLGEGGGGGDLVAVAEALSPSGEGLVDAITRDVDSFFMAQSRSFS